MRGPMIHRAGAAVGLVFSFLLGASNAVAAAPTVDECVDAHARSQPLRREGKLRDAREALRVCSSASCPKLVRDECTPRLDELERTVPSVVFDARDNAGKALTRVRVTVDGKVSVESLDGKGIEVDPGDHVFVLDAAGQESVTKRITLRAGDRGQREPVLFHPLKVATKPVVEKPPGADKGTGGGPLAGLVDVSLSAGLDLWAAGVNGDVGLASGFSLAGGYSVVKSDRFQVRAGAKLGYSFLNDIASTDHFTSALADALVRVRLWRDRLYGLGELGVGGVMISGLERGSALLVAHTAPSGSVLALEVRPAIGVEYRFAPSYAAFVSPALVYSPTPQHFAGASLVRFELAAGASLFF